MKPRISPTIRISFGLIMLTLSILFVGDWLGLIPREQTLQLEQRKKFSESLAVQLSSLAQDGDSRHIRTTLEAIVERDDDVDSAAFRSLEGLGSVEIGNHSANWMLDEVGEYSTLNQVIVPIFRGGKRWGSVEVRFTNQNAAWYSAISNNSFIMLVIFITLSGFILYLLFLRRVLRELDPSQVVPERVKSAFNSLAEGVLILDEEGHIVLANNAFVDNASVHPSKIVGASVDDMNWSAYHSEPAIRDERYPWTRVLSTGEALTGEKLTIHKDSNLERSYRINCTPIYDDKNTIRGVIGTFDDVTELEKNNETLNKTLNELKQSQVDVTLKNTELQQLATRDPLTDCLNRRAFNEQLHSLFDQATRAGTDLVCIMADIDHFKRVNDNYGHAVGDKVIKFVADVLKRQIRQGDVLGRYGGEEFCILLEGSSIEQASKVAERMRMEITTGDPSLFTSALRVSASFGLVSISEEPDNKDELVNKADKALYLAKEGGRNKVMVWENDSKRSESGETRPDQQTKKTDRVTEDSEIKLVPPLQQTDVDKRIKQLEQIALEQTQQFDRYANYDPLTQLPERNLFIDRVEQALLRAKRDGGVLAVLSLGLDNLQRVNDTLGHESAQEFLRQTANRLSDVLRVSDSISLISASDSESTVSKLSEGEFGLLLPSVEDTESITWIVKRIFDALQEPLFINDYNVTISSNVGIGVYPDDAEDAITLIKHASISRFYAEQQAGTDNTEYFSEHINRVSRDQLNLESEMSEAINNEDFEVLYQPKISVATGQINGFEALLRWNHRTRGLLTPNEFIDIAERTRFINIIGDWVLRQSCVQIKELSEACGRELSIAVNLSAVQFSQDNLVDRITNILQETGMNPRDLELELTENCLIENMDFAFRSLANLQASGVNISIDDFGTGYSSLSYLRSLPINILKVDRCFVADIGVSDHDKAIVSAIVGMAKSLDLTIVAEGVETRGQLDVLVDLGCDEVQGYLFSRPVSLEKARDLLLGVTKLANVS